MIDVFFFLLFCCIVNFLFLLLDIFCILNIKLLFDLKFWLLVDIYNSIRVSYLIEVIKYFVI